MGEILFFAISSEADDPLTLRTIADTTVRRRLLAVPGVSQVTPIGGAERQFQVIAHPDRLRANDVSLTELLDAVRGASQNTSAGIYTEGAQEYVLEAIGRVRNAEEIGDTVVALRGERSVLVRDVADVREGAAFKRGEGSRSGKPAVIVGVQKQPGANTIEVTARLDRAARRAAAGAAAGHDDRPADLPQADFIEVAVDNVDRRAARRRRPRHRHRAALPGELPRRGHHADGDAAVAGGRGPGAARVRRQHQHDDARRHGDRHRRARGRCDHRRGERGAPAARERSAAARASGCPRRSSCATRRSRSASSIVFATVIIVLVFLPVFGLSGVEGRLLTPLAFAYIVALLASLAVAIVVTPALCVAFLPQRRVDPARTRRLAGARAQGAVRTRPAAARSIIRAWSSAAPLVLLVAAGVALTRAGTRSCRSSTKAA